MSYWNQFKGLFETRDIAGLSYSELSLLGISLLEESSPTDIEKGFRRLLELGNVDGAKAILDAYQEAYWRETQYTALLAMSGLGHHSRVLHFLIKLALQKDDLQMGEVAIRALGLTGRSLAVNFIKSLYESTNEPPHIKPLRSGNCVNCIRGILLISKNR